jgi:hypothetical protein
VPSLLELIIERETAATAAAEHLRAQIAVLTKQLALAESELAGLATTRTTLARLTGQTGDQIETAAAGLTPVDQTVASPAYQNILAVFDTATGAMRAKDVCLALGPGCHPERHRGNPRETQTPRRPPHPGRGRAGPVHARPNTVRIAPPAGLLSHY